MVVLMEAMSRIKSKAKYNCPYCDNYRDTRMKLVNHITKYHEDSVPDGYTPLRVVYDIVNKNPNRGKCIIDKADCKWNESKARYDRLCGKSSCKEKYKELVKSRNNKIYGVDDPTKDPRYSEELQKKALANRKISGKYRFKDGGDIGYTGSYEKKLLEFMDTVMNIKSEDLLSPAPTIIYQYNGSDHMYIPDFLYIPYNLIIEVKDGGDNKAKNIGNDTREKTLAKEKAIRDQNKYNYVRLTNNDFAQFIEVFCILRLSFGEDNKIIQINESTPLSSINTIPNNSSIYLVQYMDGNIPTYGITNDIKSDKILVNKDGGISIINPKEYGKYNIFRMVDENKSKDIYNNTLKSFLNKDTDIDSSTNYFYKKYTGKLLLSEDQLLFDKDYFIKENTIEDTFTSITESFNKYIYSNDSIDKIENISNDIESLNKINLKESSTDDIDYTEDITPSQYKYNDIKDFEELMNKINSCEKDGSIIVLSTDITDYNYIKSENGYIVTIINFENFKDKYNKLLTLSSNRIASSNNTCIQLFGIDNYSLYELSLKYYNYTTRDDIEYKNNIVENSISVEKEDSLYPYFTPTELDKIGVFSDGLNLYSDNPDNTRLSNDITTSDWFNMYKDFKGDLIPHFDLWYTKLRDLYLDYRSVLHSDNINKINARKQSILELGWNPEIDFNIDLLKSMVTRNRRKTDRRQYIDLSMVYNTYDASKRENIINNSSTLQPLYIININNTNNIYISFKSYFKQSEIFEIVNDIHLDINENSVINLFVIFIDNDTKTELENIVMNRSEEFLSINHNIKYEINKSINYLDIRYIRKNISNIIIYILEKYCNLEANKDLKMYKLYQGSLLEYNSHKTSNMISDLLLSRYDYIKECMSSSIKCVVNNDTELIDMFVVNNFFNTSSQEIISIDSLEDISEYILESLEEYLRLDILNKENNLEKVKSNIYKLYYTSRMLLKIVEFRNSGSIDDRIDTNIKNLNNLIYKYLSKILEQDKEFNLDTEYKHSKWYISEILGNPIYYEI